MTFQYPKELPAKYISKTEWPPVIRIETGTYSCQTTPPEISSLSEIISQRLVDDRTYCVNIKNEGAAGSVYSSYVYTTVKNGQLVNVSFTLRYPDCNNYDEEQNKACVSEREVFDIDATVDRIVQTIKWDLSQDESPSTQLANPASVNCTKSGGNLVIKKRSDGGEYGVCFFEDNRQCEEWALLRNDCPVGGLKITGYENEAEIFCVITGGQVTGLETATPMWKRIDGTLCTVSANFDGACPDPNNPTPNAGNVEAQ
jgi:putative hemolysin